MRKKILSVLLSAAVAVSLAACAGGGSSTTAAVTKAETKAEETKAEETKAEETKAEETTEAAAEAGEDFHIGIVTGSVSQSEDDRRGAEAFQAKYGEENVTLAIYPDNFTEELETTIQTIVNLSDDPDSLKMLGQADGAVLVEKIGVSRYSSISNVLMAVRAKSVPVIGSILL